MKKKILFSVWRTHTSAKHDAAHLSYVAPALAAAWHLQKRNLLTFLLSRSSLACSSPFSRVRLSEVLANFSWCPRFRTEQIVAWNSELGRTWPTMPKNKGKGGKNRRRGKNENESEKRELIFKEDEQEYAQVTKMLGNGRLEAMCFDGVKRLCHIRGKLRKKVCDAGESKTEQG